MKIKSGQSIIEVVIVTTLISIGVIASLSLVNRSQSQSRYSRLLESATSYNNQIADYFRDQKSLIGWSDLVAEVGKDSGGGNSVIYCMPSIPTSILEFQSYVAGTCEDGNFIRNTMFLRTVEFDTSSANEGVIRLTLTTAWNDKTLRSSILQMELTQWK